MQELMLISNPAKRPSKRRKSTKAASPAQKRARAAFAAAARARSTNPAKRAKRRVKRARTTGVTIMSNPRKRRTKRTAVRARARRRNPISMGRIKPMSLLQPALIGAVGAAAVNTILGKLPIPASAMTGNMKYLTQAAAALALAVIGSKVGGKSALFAQMAEGSLTVTLHQALVEGAGNMGMNLSGINGMGMYLPGRQAMMPSRNANPAMLAGMSSYVSGPGAGRGTPGLQQTVSRNSRGMRGFGF